MKKEGRHDETEARQEAGRGAARGPPCKTRTARDNGGVKRRGGRNDEATNRRRARGGLGVDRGGGVGVDCGASC